MMIDKTITFVLGHTDFRTLGSSRTDAMVSANHGVFELFLNAPIDEEPFLREFNKNLPFDIRALVIERITAEFNVIQAPKLKEYIYLFTIGEKPHPFCASIMSIFMDDLEISIMMEGAKVFEGEHNFKKYCARSPDKKTFVREVLYSRIEVNTIFQASWFPERSFVYHIHAKGFLRNQIRLMMGQLVKLGKGEVSLKQLQQSLSDPDETPFDYIAPASGLMLNKVVFDEGAC